MGPSWCHPPPKEPAVFGIDFIYLMTAALMTLLAWLVVSQTPSRIKIGWGLGERIEGSRRARWRRRGGSRGGGERERRRKKGDLGGLCLSQTSKDTWKLITVAWANSSAGVATQMKQETPQPLIRLVSSTRTTRAVICSLELKCGSAGTGLGYTQGIFRNYYRLGDKQDISFFKRGRGKMEKPCRVLYDGSEEEAGLSLRKGTGAHHDGSF